VSRENAFSNENLAIGQFNRLEHSKEIYSIVKTYYRLQLYHHAKQIALNLLKDVKIWVDLEIRTLVLLVKILKRLNE
jgi:hypothetical protein